MEKNTGISMVPQDTDVLQEDRTPASEKIRRAEKIQSDVRSLDPAIASDAIYASLLREAWKGVTQSAELGDESTAVDYMKAAKTARERAEMAQWSRGGYQSSPQPTSSG